MSEHNRHAHPDAARLRELLLEAKGLIHGIDWHSGVGDPEMDHAVRARDLDARIDAALQPQPAPSGDVHNDVHRDTEPPSHGLETEVHPRGGPENAGARRRPSGEAGECEHGVPTFGFCKPCVCEIQREVDCTQPPKPASCTWCNYSGSKRVGGSNVPCPSCQAPAAPGEESA